MTNIADNMSIFILRLASLIQSVLVLLVYYLPGIHTHAYREDRRRSAWHAHGGIVYFEPGSTYL